MNALLLALALSALPPLEPQPATATVPLSMDRVLTRFAGPLAAGSADSIADSVQVSVASRDRVVDVSFRPDPGDAQKTVIEVSIRGRIGKFIEKAIAEAIAKAILKRIIAGIMGNAGG